MNSLNSILIEGTVIANTKKNGECTEITIETLRSYTSDGVRIHEIDNFCILTSCSVSEKLIVGTGVRAVGRIKNFDGFIKIVAEHIEIKGGNTE